ncbi:MAG: flavodoxin domain-containing protein [Syntrophobacteraceae bacterium]|nr:flavodoxin domain-containing protein [Syntrophobacteraceae bacterium]
MKALNLYFSTTGNTEKIAEQIEMTLREQGVEVETFKVTGDHIEPDILAYDLVFAGSGVYAWLPGKPMMALLGKLREKYFGEGEIKPASPRRHGKKAVVYCSYGGGHTGANEAVPAVKYISQLFDHLGYEVMDEWYFVGQYHGKHSPMSINGRLGNIEGRPNEADLREVSEKVAGILKV